MFENYDRGRNYKRRKEFFIPAIVVMLLVLVGIQVRADWQIERLAMPQQRTEIDLIPADDPAPAPLKKGSQKKNTEKVTEKKVTVVKKETVQPTEKKEDKAAPVTSDAPEQEGFEHGTDINGSMDGVVGGTGTCTGPDCGTAPTPPPPPPPADKIVPPSVLKGFRVSGDDQIQPNDMTKREIQTTGKNQVVGNVQYCVSVDGAVNKVTLKKSTGFASYDTKLVDGVKQWKFKPPMVNGVATPQCTVVTFIFRMT